ncbi:hypothetical protein M011DRAFT_319964 [Sporormia fimetaria CBS 119925]|uniref:Uncharacterized protein n=1 Tax=Sporormia fimetaria CBS 119925 TaxID=1340428 RepID=A0A6A6VGX1_9PLEO|nr:hypothetical protein M011DRAFT_319964 [Sporormia fimetaria CBS 119925]
MLSSPLRSAVLTTAFSSLTFAAQTSKIIPQELAVGLASSSVELQVSYFGQAENGFLDGTTFEEDAVFGLPKFALGDSSGISSQKRYTILLLDTTCSQQRLHYARANFKYNFQIVSIESLSIPALPYQRPGAFGETGDERKYSFLMFSQPQGREIEDLKIPGDGEAFDIGTFKSQNGLKDASGGVGMVVKLGGETTCGEGAPVAPGPGREPARPQQPQQPEEEEEEVVNVAPLPRPEESAAPPAATSNTPPQAPAPSPRPTPATSVRIDDPLSDVSLVIVDQTTERGPASPIRSLILDPEDQPPEDDVTQTSSGAVLATPPPSTTLVTSFGPDVEESEPTGSETTTGAPLEATTSGVGSSKDWGVGYLVMISVVLFAGLLV